MSISDQPAPPPPAAPRAACLATAAPAAAIGRAAGVTEPLRTVAPRRADTTSAARASHAAAGPTTVPVTVTPAPPPTLPTTAPVSTHTSLITAGVLLLPALCVAALTGVFRRGIRTPDRIESDRSALPLLLVTGVAGMAWFMTQVVYGQYAAMNFARVHPGQKFTVDQFGANDFAFLSTVPAVVGLVILVFGDALIGAARRLGYGLGRLPGGVLAGAIAAVGVLPLVWGGSILLDLLYRAVRFEHPAEHELLGAMKDAPHHVRILLVIGACVAAPVFEELLFRGHLQTLIGRAFTSRAGREIPAARALERPVPVLFPEMYSVVPGSADTAAAGDVPTGAAAAAAGEVQQPLPLEYSISHPDPNRPRRNAWLAIFLTSVLFALVHPMWMAPLIFVLALCLGYVYERTGNLWACIALHAIFNTSSTIMFLG